MKSETTNQKHVPRRLLSGLLSACLLAGMVILGGVGGSVPAAANGGNWLNGPPGSKITDQAPAGVFFTAPETIYLNPIPGTDYCRLQYFADQYPNNFYNPTGYSVTPSGRTYVDSSSVTHTYGLIYFHCSNMTEVTIRQVPSANPITLNYWAGNGYAATPYATNRTPTNGISGGVGTKHTGLTNVHYYITDVGKAANYNDGLITWEAEFKITGSDTVYYAYAYSSIYAPWLGIYGAALQQCSARTGGMSTDAYTNGGMVLWMMGAHEVDVETLSTTAFTYPNTGNNQYNPINYSGNVNSSGTENLVATGSGHHANRRVYGYQTSGTTSFRRLDYGGYSDQKSGATTNGYVPASLGNMQDGNATGFINRYLSLTSPLPGGGSFAVGAFTDQHNAFIWSSTDTEYGNICSPTGRVWVDRSRYTNLKDIPNLAFNMTVNDMTGEGSYPRVLSLLRGFYRGTTAITGLGYNDIAKWPDGFGDEFGYVVKGQARVQSGSWDLNPATNVRAGNDTGQTNNVMYVDVSNTTNFPIWNTNTYMYFRSWLWLETGNSGTVQSFGNTELKTDLRMIDKSTMRAKLNQEIGRCRQPWYYTNVWDDAANDWAPGGYTLWTNYKTAMENLARAICRPNQQLSQTQGGGDTTVGSFAKAVADAGAALNDSTGVTTGTVTDTGRPSIIRYNPSNPGAGHNIYVRLLNEGTGVKNVCFPNWANMNDNPPNSGNWRDDWMNSMVAPNDWTANPQAEADLIDGGFEDGLYRFYVDRSLHSSAAAGNAVAPTGRYTTHIYARTGLHYVDAPWWNSPASNADAYYVNVNVHENSPDLVAPLHVTGKPDVYSKVGAVGQMLTLNPNLLPAADDPWVKYTDIYKNFTLEAYKDAVLMSGDYPVFTFSYWSLNPNADKYASPSPALNPDAFDFNTVINDGTIPFNASIKSDGQNHRTPGTNDVDIYVIWKPRLYKASYRANNGKTSTFTDSAAGHEIDYYTPYQILDISAIAADPSQAGKDWTKPGYTFRCWASKPNPADAGYVAYGTEIVNPVGPQELYAIWDPEDATVTYDANGGLGTMTADTAVYDMPFALTTNAFTKTGYDFFNWNTAADGTGDVYTNTQAFNPWKSTTGLDLFAMWKPKNFAITFDKNDPAATGSMADQNFAYGETRELDANKFKKSGYSFYGWNTVDVGGGSSYLDGANYGPYTELAGRTLYAQWGPEKHDIIYKANGGTGTMPTNEEAISNVAVTLATNTFTKTGYGFQGWATSQAAANTGTVTYTDGVTIPAQPWTSDLELYAVWEADTHSITYDANGGTGAITSTSVTYGSAYSIADGITLIPPSINEQFVGWSTTSGTGNNADYLPGLQASPYAIDGDLPLYAVWELNTALPYIIEIYKMDNISGYPASPDETLLPRFGEDGEFVEAQYSDYTDADSALYELDASKGDDLTATLDEDTVSPQVLKLYLKRIEVAFAYDLTVTGAEPSGGLEPEAGNLIWGSEITIVGEPTRPGYDFVEWEIKAGTGASVSGTKGEEVTIGTTATTVAAVWEIIPKEAKFVDKLNAGLTETVVHTSTAYYGYKLYVTVPAGPGVTTQPSWPTAVPTKAGYNFVGWFSGSDSIGNGTGTEITAAGYTHSVEDDVKFYAKWELVPYTATFMDDLGGAGITVGTSKVYFGYGFETVPAGLLPVAATQSAFPAAPTKAGYTFIGWFETSDGDGNGDGAEVKAGGAAATEYVLATSDHVTFYAQWEIDKYTASFIDNLGFEDDTPLAKSPVYIGYDFNDWPIPGVASADRPEYPTTLTPTRTGYDFLGWYSSFNSVTGNGIGAGITPAYVHETPYDVSFYAGWDPWTYRVEYEAGTGGSGPLPADIDPLQYDEEFHPAACPLGLTHSSDYKFAGWKVNDSGDAYFSTDTLSKLATVKNETVKLVAQWEMDYYPVVYKANNGTTEVDYTDGDPGAPFHNSYTLLDDGDMEFTFTPPTNKVFAGWNTEADGVGGTAYAGGQTVPSWPTADEVVLYAQWRGAPYDVVYHANGGVGADYTDTDGGHYGEAYTLLGNGTTGFTNVAPLNIFAGWSETASNVLYSAATWTQESTATKHFYAVWMGGDADYDVEVYLEGVDENDYSLEWSDTIVDGGTAGLQLTLDPEDALTLASVDSDLYTLDSDNIDCTDTTQTIAADGSTTFTYYYKRTSFALTVNLNGGTSGGPEATGYRWGSDVDLTTIPVRAGFTFQGWKCSGGLADIPDTATDFEMPQKALTITAQWGYTTYYIQLDLNYTGSAAPTDITLTSNQNYNQGTGWKEYPTRSGYDFGGWWTNANGTGTRVNGGTKVSSQAATLSENSLDPTIYYAKWTETVIGGGGGGGGGGGLGTANYTVEIYLQQADGTYVKSTTDSYTRVGTVGMSVSLTGKEYSGAGYAWNSDKSVTSGMVTSGGGLVLKLYYDRACKITYDANGGSAVASDGLRSGEKKTITATSTKANYGFAGWELISGDATYDAATKVLTMGTTDVVLRAKWSKQGVSTVATYPDGKPIGPVDLSGSTMPELDSTPDWKFLGWYTKDNVKVTDPSKLANGVELTPIFGRKYLISYKVNETDGFIITVGVDNVLRIVWYSGQFGQGLSEKGEPLTLASAFPTPTRPGYTFAGWWYLDGGVEVEIKSMTQVWKLLSQTLYPTLGTIPPGLDVNGPKASPNLSAPAGPQAGEVPVLTLYARWREGSTQPGDVGGKIERCNIWWRHLLHALTVGIFWKDFQKVTIIPDDPDATAEYYVGEKDMTLDQLANVNWTPYGAPFRIHPPIFRCTTVYARLTDGSGNMVIIKK